MLRRSALVTGAVLTCLIALGLVLLAPVMAPIGRGTSAEFWHIACGVELAPDLGGWGSGLIELGPERIVYERRHLHGSGLRVVPRAVAIADFPRVLEALEARAASALQDDPPASGYRAWKDMTGADSASDADKLIGCIDEARKARLTKASPDLTGYAALQRYFFERRLQQAGWYWANLVFEFSLLGAIVWIALWPAIRGHAAWRWALHFSAALPLFAMPLYLGYATYSLTSAGPSGGVLYPWLVLILGGGWMNDVDQALLARLPQVLEPLSQGIGTPMAISGRGCHGPTTVLCMALVAGAVGWFLGWRGQAKHEREATVRAAAPA